MSGVTVSRSVPVGWSSKLAWGAGALVVGTFMPWALVLLAIGAGLFVVATLGFGEPGGVLTYLAFFGMAALAYAGSIYGVIRLAGAHTEVPWIVWPALLAAPVGGLIAASPLVDAYGVPENPTVVPAVVGIAIAFIALGSRRWSKVA
ncbi:MAG: hypothetical protein RBS17_02525 [Coriobacteriia bacterium]|nr:hypothetical protein [Coriobacteriia bacterium]